MKSVSEIAEEIVTREGGFVNDPDDPGGATKYGVTLPTLRRLGADVTGDGRIDASDVRNLTRERAIEILVEFYFKKPNLASLPECLQPSVFDMTVNAGANAVKILQRLLAEMGFDLVQDGVLGRQTALAAEAAAVQGPELLVDAYGIARRNYYYRIADARPASRKYARKADGSKGGWILRAEEFISPRFHLTDAEHRERTAAWA